MLRPIIVSLCSFSVAIAGCTSQNASDQKNDGSTPTAAMPSIPKSKQDSATPFQSQDLGAAEKLIIKVDSRAQIRTQQERTRTAIWFAGQTIADTFVVYRALGQLNPTRLEKMIAVDAKHPSF